MLYSGVVLRVITSSGMSNHGRVSNCSGASITSGMMSSSRAYHVQSCGVLIFEMLVS